MGEIKEKTAQTRKIFGVCAVLLNHVVRARAYGRARAFHSFS